MSTFSFNGALSATGSLTPRFARATQTMDPEGTLVPPGTPRFDRPAMIAGVELPFVFDPMLRYGNVWLLDSGFDHDGQSELLVVSDANSGRIIVYDNPLDSSSKRVTQLMPAPCSVASGNRGFLNSFAMGTDPNSGRARAYNPVAGCVCHGFIALWCAALLQADAGDWDIAGSGVVYSTDRGQTWDRLFDDLDQPAQMLLSRGALWSLQKYFTPYHDSATGAPLTEAWMAATDYRLPYGAQQAALGDARGGRFFVWRLMRAGAGAPWQVGDDFGVAARLDMSDVCPSGHEMSRHAHAAGIVRWGLRGLRLVGSLGDSRRRQRFMTATLPDHLGPYTRPGDWTTSDDYHGRAGHPAPPYHPDYGACSPQPIACMQGRGNADGQPADGRTLFWGADNGSELLFQMRCPDAGPPTIAHVLGTEATQCPERGGTSFNSLWMLRTQAPERETPIVGIAMESTDIGGNVNAQRIVYTPGSTPGLPNPTDGQWASVGAGRLSADSAPAPFLVGAPFGPLIVLGATGYFGLQAIAIPAVKSVRPVKISPGGRNLVCDRFIVDAPMQSVVPLQRANGGTGPWVDGPPGGPLTPLDPQPPTLAGQVFRVTVDGVGNPSSLITRMRPATDDPSLPTGNRAGWDIRRRQMRRFRFLAMDASAGPLSPLPSPSQTIYSLRMQFGRRVRGWGSRATVVSGNRWMPHTLNYADRDRMDNAPCLELWCSAQGETNDSVFYLALDQAREDNRSFGYPMPGGPPFVSAPDEQLRITDLGLSGDFTVLLAGLMPRDDWDARTPRSGDVWPLVSLRNGQSFFIELGAVAHENGSGGFQVQASGLGIRRSSRFPWSNTVYWMHRLQLLVGIQVHSGILTVMASVGGDFVRSLVDQIVVPSFDRSTLEVQFCGGNGEVTSFDWAGGAVIPSAIGTAAIQEQLRTLDFLNV